MFNFSCFEIISKEKNFSLHMCIDIIYSDPAGTRRQNDVVMTSVRRRHVALTTLRRHVPAGKFLECFRMFYIYLTQV